MNQKAVVFTESKRTQKYIAAELRKSGYSEEDILLFNGDFDDAMTKEIFEHGRSRILVKQTMAEMWNISTQLSIISRVMPRF